MKVWVIAGDGFAIDDVLGLELDAIGSEEEPGFEAGRGRAITQRSESRRHVAYGTNLDVDMIALEHAVGQIGLVRTTAPQLAQRRFFVAKGFQEGKRERYRVKWRFGEL